jgi:amino acid adenylation domain-containing protein
MKAKSFSQEKNVAANQNIKEREYWLNQLSGEWEKSVFLYDNPTAEPGTVGNKWRLEEMDFKLSAPLCERLLHMANGSDTRLYCLILTAVTVLIDKYTGNNDIIVGAPIYRQKKEDEGDFINTVLTLRNRIGTGVTFKELLITVSKNLFEVTEHQNYPVKTLLYKLNIPFSENDFFPLFDIVILLENIHDKNYILDIKTNIVFSFSRDGREVKGTMEYNRFLYREKTIQRIINHFKHLLHIALFNIDIQVSSIDLSTNKEKKRLLLDFNDTAREYPGDQTVHQLFEKQVTQTPEHIAVVGKEQHITYRELNKKANQLARFLRKKGVKPDVIVGLMVDRSLEMIIGILGVLKAGGSYLSIDPGTPKKRALLMLEDGAASLVLTKKNLDKDFEYSILATGYLNPAKPYLGPPRQSIKDLNHLPIPDRTLVDYEKYNQYIGQVMAKDCLSIQATRGCPYKCAYCHKIWPKNHVVRTAENILSEIKLFYDMGVRRFSFVDDIFNLDRSNSTHFFQLIKKNGLDLQLFFPNGLRGDQLTRDFIDLMVEVGTVNLTLSLETASPRLQKLIGKNLDIEKLRENILYICETYPQVILELQTMHGLPTETEEEALMTLKFLKSTQWLHFAYVNILIIYPNTDMMKIALENGIIYEQIAYSNRRAAHELPDTLPFKKSFTTKYQSEFLNEYFLLKDRLLHVLPYQMKIMTRDEMVQKYNSYLPTEINRFSDLLQLANIRTNELTHHEFVSDHKYAIPNLNEKIKKIFPPKSKKPSPQALKILFLDLSQFFSGESDMLYDVVEPPLGLMYLCTYLNREFCNHIRSRITKSRIDFDDYNRLKNLLGTFKPDIIGVRTLTFYKDFFHKTIAFIRQWGFRGPIIAGGPYATSDYNTLLQDRNIDLAALGEGEITLSEVVKKILENDGNLPPEPVLKEIPGIAFMPKSNASKTNVNRDIICLDEQENIFSRESPENPEPVNQPDDLAYTIFTSGSTGRPKGAMIRHQGLTNYIWWAANTFVKEEKTDFPLYTSYAFDLTVTSIFTPLITGNAIVLYEGDDKEILIENVIEENRVGVLKATPSHLKLVRDKKPGNSSIKRIISGGEVLETGLAKEITRNFHHKVTIYNEYGPTETVVGSMIYQFNEETDNKKCVPIGVPIDNVQIYILDEYLEPAPIGVAGELVIAGDGVARGYLNNPELTAKKFDHDSWDYQDYHDEKRRVKIKKNNQKCTTFNRSYKSYKSYISQKKYKTGDLARWLPEGKIELLGRSDQQVKIRGFRIEPGEIEQQMMRQPDIKEAAVIARKDEEGHVYLCAYYVPTVISAPGEGVNISEMRQHLSLTLTLPDYMIPSHFVRQERMPLTSNGKLDRTRLPAPQALIDSKNYVPPRNDTEEKLAEIWQDILGIDKSKIGIANNFFELGGHSLKAVLLISRIHKELNVKVSLADIFETHTEGSGKGVLSLIHIPGRIICFAEI